jgi:hypothetical protein
MQTANPVCGHPQGQNGTGEAPRGGHYIAVGLWNLLGGLEDDLNENEAERVQMVAGEGFEPSTLGL